MARIRSVKPTYWTDEKIGLLPREVRLTFLGLISAMADDHGRLSGVARIVRGAVYPFDEDVTTADIEDHLAQIATAGLIVRYAVNGSQYIHIRNWKKHQKVDRPSASLLPPPPDDTEPAPGPIVEHSTIPRRTIPTERSGAEGSGEDGERSGADARAAVSETAAPEDPPPPRVILPASAERFLNMFYPARGERERERYLNVKAQLYDVLDPQHPGPKIRGGARVKARSAAHLEACIADVMRDPPMDRDVAIVFLLKKLTNPPKGPTAAEVASDKDKASMALEERYHAELKAAGVLWAKEHPDEYEAIRKEVDRQFRDAGGSLVGRLAKDASLAQRCGTAAGFPEFKVWAEQQGVAA